MRHTLSHEEEMRTYAAMRTDRALIAHKGVPAVFGLVGELGAGKTTFVRAAARHLGIEEPVPSPTFLIKKEYSLPASVYGKERFVHVDAYRIDDADELEVVGISTDIEDPVTITFVEWADRVKERMPIHTAWLYFSAVGATTRIIEEKDG